MKKNKKKNLLSRKEAVIAFFGAGAASLLGRRVNGQTIEDTSNMDQEGPDMRYVVTFSTVEAMKALSPVDIAGNAVVLNPGLSVRTLGNVTRGDGGGAFYDIKTVGEYGGAPDEAGDHTLGNGNVAELQKGAVIYASQFGTVSDYNGTTGTDNSAAIIAAGLYARKYGIKCVELPAGPMLVTEAGTFSLQGPGVVNGIKWKGQGLGVTEIYFINNDPAEDNYLVDNDDAELRVLYEGIRFTGSSTNRNARWARVNSTTGQAQSLRHNDCMWLHFNQIMSTSGSTNASEMLFTSCKFWQIYSKAFVINNVQSMNHVFTGCDFELHHDSVFRVEAGGHITVFGGSFILTGSSGYVLDTHGSTSEIGTSNWTYNFQGIKTELREGSSLVSMQSAGIAMFIGCNIGVITGPDISRVIGDLGHLSKVVFHGGHINGKFSLRVESPSTWASPFRVAQLDISNATLGNLFDIERISASNASGRGRVTIRNCKKSQDYGSTEILDADYGWRGSRSPTAAPIKTATIAGPSADLPAPGGTATIHIPVDAALLSVRLVHIAQPGPAGLVFTVTNGDNTTTYGSWTFDAYSAISEKIDSWKDRLSENDSTLVLRADPSNYAGVYNGYVLVEYI